MAKRAHNPRYFVTSRSMQTTSIARLARSQLRRIPFSSRFARNWSFLVASNLACQALGMLATIRVARTLAPEGYGQYNLVLTVASLGTVVAWLGFRNVVIRECARHPERSGNLFIISAIFRSVTVAIVGVGILVYGLISANTLPGAFPAISVALVVSLSAWELVENVAFGHEHMEYTAGINLAGSVMWVLAAWAVPKEWLTPTSVSVAYASLQGIEALAYIGIAGRMGYLRKRAHTDTWSLAQSLLKQSLPFYWLAVLTAATNQLPILFLAQRSGQAEVGFYNVGMRLIYPMQMLLTTALTALYPNLARTGNGRGGEEGFLTTVQTALSGLVLLGTSGALVISLLRQELVSIVFGKAYLNTADALAFQCWYSVLFAIFALIGTSLAACDRQKLIAWLSTAYAALGLPVLWWGAGRGATGLSLAILISAVINISYHWIFFQRSLPKQLSTSHSIRLLLVLLTGMIVAWVVPQSLAFIWRLAASAGWIMIMLPVITREARLSLLSSTNRSPAFVRK